MRKIPSELAEAWQRLPTDPPLAALASSRQVHRTLANWQNALVKEAVEDGASWEEIGVALGTSKQGAWARFRAAVGEQGGQGTMHDPVLQTKQRVRELWNAEQARLSEMDTKWREEQQRLRQQVHESKDRLAEARRHHAQERREARQNLRREMEKLRKEIDAARAIS
jgi:septal ring factor EnvC (AmiA/AmiB activator)